ncbi:hypothetical protein [Hymenobacter sediminicola]|uniref:Uncharacterized protein n=1 Tax=Hymenobacter sediminicola TaxID=2761579 RepID=A0A7G7W408_9BACT|nr:hypothetical protein [Hymenobacter sediminicola]QNH61101.1 hypothetical protein H4317_13075 [Hymenobacter sediminicola]
MRCLHFLSHVLLFLALAGCQRPVSSATAALGPAATTETTAEKPAVVFLTFRVVAAGAGQPARITLLRSQAAPGRLKATTAPTPSTDADHLAVRLLDAAGQPLGTATVVEHPLRKSVEYTDEKQQLGRRVVSLPEAEFFVRLSLPAQATQVRVEEVAAATATVIASTSFPLLP